MGCGGARWLGWGGVESGPNNIRSPAYRVQLGLLLLLLQPERSKRTLHRVRERNPSVARVWPTNKASAYLVRTVRVAGLRPRRGCKDGHGSALIPC